MFRAGNTTYTSTQLQRRFRDTLANNSSIAKVHLLPPHFVKKRGYNISFTGLPGSHIVHESFLRLQIIFRVTSLHTNSMFEVIKARFAGPVAEPQERAVNQHWPFVEPTLARNWANIGITLVQLTVLLHWVNKSEKKRRHSF